MGIGITGAYSGYSIYNAVARDFARAAETGRPVEPNMVKLFGSAVDGRRSSETLKMADDFVNVLNNKSESGPMTRSATSPTGNGTDSVKAADDQKTLQDEECQTCANRKYVDVSDDSGVSYQIPTNIPRSEAAAKVISHEHQHVSREQAKAKLEDKEVVAQGVKIETSICPECGKTYVSGGETTTVTKAHSHDGEEASDAPAEQADNSSLELVKNADYYEQRSRELKNMFMTAGIDRKGLGNQLDLSA